MEDFNILINDINNLLKKYTEKTGIIVKGNIYEIVKYVEAKPSILTSFIPIDDNKLYILKKHKRIEDMISDNYEEILKLNYKINTKEELIKLWPNKYAEIEEKYDLIIEGQKRNIESSIKFKLEESKNIIEKCNNYYNKLIELNNHNNIFKYVELLNILKTMELYIREETCEIYYKGNAYIMGGYAIEYVLEIENV
jgi:hypothetical protein